MPANGATATSSAVAGNVRFKAVAELTSMAEMRREAVVRVVENVRRLRAIPLHSSPTDERASPVRNEPSLHQIDANYGLGTDADGATSTAQGVQRPLCRDEVDDWIPSVKCVDHRLQTRRGLMDTTVACQNWC